MPELIKLERTIKMQGPQVRVFHLDRSTINEEARTVELSFSSETRDVQRWFGIEVLGHKPEEVRLGRLNAAGPVLMDHNMRDQVAVIEKAWIDEKTRKGRALVRFGKSSRAQEIWQDVLDEIRSNVSVSYVVHRFILEQEGKNGNPDVLRAVDWEPLEISIVSVPADTSVGVGRAKNYDAPREIEIFTTHHRERKIVMKRCSACGHEHDHETCPRCQGRGLTPPTPHNNPSVPVVNDDQARAAERKRITEIQACGRTFESVAGVSDLTRQFVENSGSVEAFQAAVLEKMRAKPIAIPEPQNFQLNEREDQQYSVRNAILCALGEVRSGIEMDIHQQLQKNLGRSSNGIFIPLSLKGQGGLRAATTANVGTNASGGYAVATQVMPLIEILRNKMMTRALGARVLSGLVSDLSFPRQIASASLTWNGENPGSDVSESDLSAFLGTVSMTPKTAQSTTGVTRQLLAQGSEDIEMLLRDDLATINAIGLDYAAINGSGSSNQPRGILNTTGIGSVVGGTNGLAPTWANIVSLETEVAVDNADIGNLAYLTNAKVRGKLKVTEKASSTGQFIWSDSAESLVNGYRAEVSNQVPSTLTKGTSVSVCSAIIFGNWSDLMIGEWGVVEIIADPYTKKKQGLVELTSFMLADIGIRNPVSFSAMVDALTA